MRQIRYGLFETNSSSTHSFVIMTQAQFENLGITYFIDTENDKLIEVSSVFMEKIREFKSLRDGVSLSESVEEAGLYYKEPEENDEGEVVRAARYFELYREIQEYTGIDPDYIAFDVNEWAGEYLESIEETVPCPYSGKDLVILAVYGNNY